MVLIFQEFHWNIGDKCQALYAEDGLLYMATIIDVDEKEKTCAVEFDYYENIETVDYEDIFEKDFGLKENKKIEKSVPKQRNKMQREKSVSVNIVYRKRWFRTLSLYLFVQVFQN